MDIRVRQVPPEDVIDLRHRVLRPGRPRETAHFSGDRDAGTLHYAAFLGEQIVGVATVMTQPFPHGDGPALQLRGMAVDPDLEKSGIGRALLEGIAREVQVPMWCNARESAVPFYERTGWRICSERFPIEGVGPHFCMRTD
jgi:GNAT superfamily N-acetyltransferase